MRVPSHAQVAWATVLVGVLALAPTVRAQSTKMPSTLRYGSGLLDVPVASVLPHRAIVVTYSGFFTPNGTELMTDPSGLVTGSEDAEGGWRGDLAVALGLWDLLELGATIQSLDGEASGGPIVGAFGRFTLVHPQKNGLGFAVGGRAVNSPDFGDGVGYAPTRLGVADRRLRDELGGLSIGSEFSFYTVASMDLAGFEGGLFPEHDWTLTAGWGTGMFQDGDGLDWYEFSDTEGWFAGAALHMRLAGATVLNVMTEYNGFDWNLGTQVDLGGVRVGAHVLGLNYSQDVSIYRSTKFGLSASVALCPAGLCRATLRSRARGEPIILPPPPPDTVVVTRIESPPLAVGDPTEICLGTGQSIEVFLTAEGDTLVGPARTSIKVLRPGIVLAGTYAQGQPWFESDDPVEHGGRSYARAARFLRLNCGVIERVGQHLGIPLFAMRRSTDSAYETLYVPVRPGVWQAYRVRDQDA